MRPAPSGGHLSSEVHSRSEPLQRGGRYRANRQDTSKK